MRQINTEKWWESWYGSVGGLRSLSLLFGRGGYLEEMRGSCRNMKDAPRIRNMLVEIIPTETDHNKTLNSRRKEKKTKTTNRQ